MWKVNAHCDASLIGKPMAVNQTNCSLTLGAPFDGFTGTLTPEGKVTVSGPQSCTGTATTDSIAMTCTPGTCNVQLTH